ncbi:MAG: apolipoprotein N-acyltransferase [Candidatus Binatia bacterium]
MLTRPDAVRSTALSVPATASLWRTTLAPIAAGLLVAAPWLDFSLYPLAWVAFAPLIWAVIDAPTRRAALRAGFLAGLGANVPAFYWLVYTIHVFGGFPYALAVVFYACLSAYSAVQFALFGWGLRALGFGPYALAAPVLWVSLEFLFPNLFPWRLANSQLEAPLLLQTGDLTGPYLLSFVMVWTNAGMVLALRQPRRLAPLAASALSAVALIAYGAWRMPTVQAAIDAAPPVAVGLVQGNIGIKEKDDVALFDINLQAYRELSEPLQSHVDVLIWPESVSQEWVRADLPLLPPEYNPYVGVSTFLVYGGLAYERAAGGGQPRTYNSAFLIDGGGRVYGRYDKRVLIPFGEYLPGASLFPGLHAFSPRTGQFTPGARIATLDVPGRIRLAPLICYEDTPAEIARAMTQVGAEALLTLFNDAWFGRSMAPYQHEAIAVWRAVENRRYFMRVGNAGVSSVVDPFGRVIERLGLFTPETLQAEIRPLQIRTVYTRTGDLFAWAVVGLAVALLVLRRRPQ